MGNKTMLDSSFVAGNAKENTPWGSCWQELEDSEAYDKLKVKLYLCLIKHNTINTCWGVEV
jgi:hypothetical protein